MKTQERSLAPRAAALLAAALLLAACEGVQPFQPTPSSEIPDGPGLLSGEDGGFVLYRR